MGLHKGLYQSPSGHRRASARSRSVAVKEESMENIITNTKTMMGNRRDCANLMLGGGETGIEYRRFLYPCHGCHSHTVEQMSPPL